MTTSVVVREDDERREEKGEETGGERGREGQFRGAKVREPFFPI